MLKLTHHNITLQQTASNKQDAIKEIAKQLSQDGLVTKHYVQGMLNREQQNSTFLGNGIAIPHGTTDTRDLVNKTGVVVHHFPEGVNWGEGNIAYIAIGIAAKSDEHLGILKQLTNVLSGDDVEDKLKNATTKEELISLLNGDRQTDADFTPALIQLKFPATEMIQMAAVAGGLLKNNNNVDSRFIAEIVSQAPTHLGNGLWLMSCDKGVKRTGMSLVSCADAFEVNGIAVKGLLAIASNNALHQTFLTTITQLVIEQQQAQLLSATSEQILDLFMTAQPAAENVVDAENVAVFKIKNAHGLHARPGATLVAAAKKFSATITVANLDSASEPVNAKSLMKVIGMGANYGDALQFTADGDDAQAALAGIGEAIAAGLSEGA